MSKVAKAAAYDGVASERDLWAQLAWHNVNGHEPDASETVTREDGDTYEYQLWGAMRANGGILVQVFRSPGQTASVEVWNFDAWLASMKAWPFGDFYTEVKIAADRLRMARDGMYKEKAS